MRHADPAESQACNNKKINNPQEAKPPSFFDNVNEKSHKMKIL